MKLIKQGNILNNLQQVLSDHRLNWSAKGVYAYLINLQDRLNVDQIELSTHSKGGVNTFKAALRQLVKNKYLVINNKLLIIKSIGSSTPQVTTKAGQIIRAHDDARIHQVLRNQWQIIWHHDDARVTRALVKLATYLNVSMVLYGIQCSKKHCHSYRESLLYLNGLIMRWKRNHLTSISQAQRWMNTQKLNSKPWNSETQNRIFSSRHRQMLNNTPLRHQIPNVFKNHHQK